MLPESCFRGGAWLFIDGVSIDGDSVFIVSSVFMFMSGFFEVKKNIITLKIMRTRMGILYSCHIPVNLVCHETGLDLVALFLEVFAVFLGRGVGSRSSHS